MTRPRYHPPDYFLLGIVIFLIGFGLVMLSSAGAVVGFEKFGQADYFFRRQLTSFFVGLALFFFFVRVDYHVWRRFAFPALVGTIALLLLVFFPGIGFKAGGAQRWIHLGSFLIQPSEIVKLTFVIYLSVWLEKQGKGLHDFYYGLLPFAVLLGSVVILVLVQPDLGTVITIFSVSLVLYFSAGASMKHLGVLIFGALASFFVLVKMAPYRAARLTVFLHPELDPQGKGYHINQALLAIGSGGLFGVGLGHSRQKYNFLPEVTGDSIFAVIAEELGFIVAIGLLVLFVLLLRRGLAIARGAPDNFGKYLATGVASGIIIQALINIAALSGLLPLTGIPLPFISSGGSSLVATMAGIGLLTNIARQTKT